MIDPGDEEDNECNEHSIYLDGDDCRHEDGPEGGTDEYSWGTNGC